MNVSRLVSHPFFVLFSLQTILAYEWLSGGWEKIYGGQFVSNIGKTLARFETGNPHDWYVSSLLSSAKSYPTAFGLLVQWGELLAGIGLLAALVLYVFSKQRSSKCFARYVTVAALLGGMFMNLNFYFAAGWTSPSTGGLNALLFWVQAVLLAAWIVMPRKEQKGS
jgi:thiosulfate dehydrogenase [quinone] large subunit